MSKIIRFFALWFMIFLSIPNINASERVEPIKVACILDHGFFFLEENGELSGYNYDYLQMIAQHTRWDYEFVLIDEGNTNASYDKAIEMMAQGEIDLIGTVFRSDVTDELFEFPKSNVGIVRHSLVSLANNYKITRDNYFLKNEVTMAMVEGEPINEIYKELAVLRDINTNITYVDSYDEALQLLIAEEVESIISTDTSYSGGLLNSLTTVNRTPFYFVSAKGNTDLMDELDFAMEKIDVEEPNVHQRLLAEYFGDDSQGELILTEEETLALAKFDYFNVGLMKNYPPYQFYQDDETAPYGISVEILNGISKIIGVPFRYVWLEDEADLIEKLSTAEIDFCGTLPFDYGLAKKLDVVLSQPYVSSGALWLTRLKVENPHASYYFVSDNIPYYEKEAVSEVLDIESAIIELSEYGQSSIFCDPYIAKYYLNKLGIDNIDTQTVSVVASEISLGVGKHVDASIVGLLNHAMLHLDTFEVDEIIHHNITYTSDVTLKSVLKEYAVVIYGFVIISLLSILFVVVYHVKKLQKVTKQDSMTKLFNSGHFHEYAGEVTQKLTQGSLILIDIDYFKQVNDTYGHQKGDEVIQMVAQSLKKKFRQDDMVARLGGDEFAVLLENFCNQKELEEKFKLLLEELQDNETGIPVSLSIGGHIFKEVVKYEELYDLADKNLYKVKDDGRNGYLFTE